MHQLPLARFAVLAVVSLPLLACAHGINALADIPPHRLEELANFSCVTSELAADVRDVAQPGDARYQRSAALYEGTRTGFNGVIEGIANDVENGEKVDLVEYWNRFGAAQAQQQQLVAFMQEESGFGFGGGIGLLISAATPFAKKMVKQFLEERVRLAAANYLRREFLLPAFESAQHCVVEEN